MIFFQKILQKKETKIMYRLTQSEELIQRIRRQSDHMELNLFN